MQIDNAGHVEELIDLGKIKIKVYNGSGGYKIWLIKDNNTWSLDSTKELNDSLLKELIK
jgi:hypothetical protein